MSSKDDGWQRKLAEYEDLKKRLHITHKNLLQRKREMDKKFMPPVNRIRAVNYKGAPKEQNSQEMSRFLKLREELLRHNVIREGKD